MSRPSAIIPVLYECKRCINWFVVCKFEQCQVILLVVTVACSFLRHDSAMVSTAKAENVASDTAGILREYNPDFDEWLDSQELWECSKSSGIVRVQKRMA